MGFKNTLKKGWIPVVAGSFVLMSFVAVQARDGKPQQSGSDVKGSIYLGKERQSKVKQNTALDSSAKISMQQAIDAAKTAYPEYTAVGAAIENENGYLVYGVRMVDGSGKALDVKVDAGDAKVLAADSGFRTHENVKGHERERGNEHERGVEREGRNDKDHGPGQHGEYDGDHED
jgi:uncharacterized membrane protein YkoI